MKLEKESDHERDSIGKDVNKGFRGRLEFLRADTFPCFAIAKTAVNQQQLWNIQL